MITSKSKLTQLLLIAVFSIGIYACKKELLSQTDPLSKRSADLKIRLGAIKDEFYRKNIDDKLKPKLEKGLSWIPEWGNPKIQVVNDSVSYVFYRMIGYLEKDGKKLKITEAGAATYLMVKNEKEYYKAFYYEPKKETGSAEGKELAMGNFTGKLLLSNLESGKNYLLDYVNGKAVDQQKKQWTLNKLQSVGNETSYWETQCHQEMNSCTYVTYFPTCGGQIIVEYSWDCRPPSYCQNSIWMLSDYGTQDVCEQVWFPDPPIDPGQGGGTGGGDGEGEGNDPIKEIVDSVSNPCIKAQLDSIRSVQTSIKGILNNVFSDTIQFESLQLKFKDITTLPDTTSGTAQRASATSIYFTINLNKNTLPNYSKEYIFATIAHEVLHAYMDSKITKDANGKFIINNTHQTMANDYLFWMIGALQINFPGLSYADAWGLAWGGLEDSTLWNNLTQTQKDQIRDTNRRYTSKTAADKAGTYCTS